MRINKVSIENFKCFKAVDIELGKLTLLTGANSSGKSSLMYSILGALQSGEFPFQFSPNGKYVNMGNFQEISYKHLKENIIKIGLNIDDIKDNQVDLTTWWEEDKVRKLPILKRIKVNAGFYNLEISKKKKYTLSHSLQDIEELKEDYRKSGYRKILEDYFVEAPDFRDRLPFQEFTASKEPITAAFDNFKELEELIFVRGYYYLYRNFMALKHTFQKLDIKINFINSFRLYPERTYYETTKTDLTVGKFGEDYVNQVILWETQKAKQYKELIKIMKNLSLLDEIKSRRLEGGRFELTVKVNKSSVPASLSDVGFGISQFLPIVVADLQLGEGSTLFVAQPEIHLHPGVQAEFGEYMVNRVQEANKNYIIETHSEYLLNRIRLAIVKNQISKDDVKVYYLQYDGEDVKTHRLEFTTDGRILNAPEDFFKTYMMDVMNIAVNANNTDGE